MASFKDVIGFLGLIVANGLMIVFVVIFGKIYCNYSYAFSFSLAIYGTIFFYILFVCNHRRWNPLIPVHDYKRAETLGVLHRQCFFNGLVWSANYVCLLSANPYVPGLYQVVINETNLIMVFLASQVFLGNRYRVSQWVCFVIVVLGGAVPVVESASKDAAIQLQWFLLYLFGAWAIGFANTITENVMRNHYVKRVDKLGATAAGDEKLFLIPATQYLCLTNLYGMLCVPALFWVSWMATREKFLPYWGNGMACLWTGSCNAEDNAECSGAHLFGDSKQTVGLSAMWVSSTCSFFSALLSAHLQRSKDVVYVTVAFTLAPVLSMVLFLIPITGLYDPPTHLALLSNIVTLFGGVSYKVASYVRESRPPARSALTKKFKFEPVDEALVVAVTCSEA